MEVIELCTQIGIQLKKKSAMLAIAESCTGGWIAKCVTDIAGSSQWFDRGFVTYTNAAKIDMLNVRSVSLNEHGAVSKQVAQEMAEGAITRSQARYGIAVTGVAGPGGGSDLKPVGTVCFAWAEKGKAVKTESVLFFGDREKIRFQTVCYALKKLLSIL